MSNQPFPTHSRLSSLAHSLIVSCQAPTGNPLRSPAVMAAMAVAAEKGGAAAIRAEGVADIAAIRDAVSLPIIGIIKTGRSADGGVFITPTFGDAQDLAQAGADIIALDGTPRPRPDGKTLAEEIDRIHSELGLPVMADTDSLESALYAQEAGADVIGTTLSGYTSGGPVPDGPDITLVRDLVNHLERPVIAEGRVWTREDAVTAFEAGAFAVVVGTAITNPMVTTARFVKATAGFRRESDASVSKAAI